MPTWAPPAVLATFEASTDVPRRSTVVQSELVLTVTCSRVWPGRASDDGIELVRA
jgi:hypothetical protein